MLQVPTQENDTAIQLPTTITLLIAIITSATTTATTNNYAFIWQHSKEKKKPALHSWNYIVYRYFFVLAK